MKRKIYTAQIVKTEDREVFRSVFALTEDELHLEVMEAIVDLADYLGYDGGPTEDGFDEEYEMVYSEGFFNDPLTSSPE